MWRVQHESWWLNHVDVLHEISIQEGLVDINLMNMPVSEDGMRQDKADGCMFNNWVVGDGRGPSSGPSSNPTTKSMAKRIQEDWDSATDGRETFIYMFEEDHKK